MKKLVLVVFALAAVACGRIDTYRFPLSKPSSAVSPSRPAIYFEGNLPNAAMHELAIVEAVGSGNKGSPEDVTNAMVDEAARWGASAIVRVKVDCGYGICHGWGVAVRFQ